MTVDIRHDSQAEFTSRTTQMSRPLDIFKKAKDECRPVYVSAPMVRYSKLPFRLLVKEYRVDITFTPMILAHEFVRSDAARSSDFTTNPYERDSSHALIAQFAASEPTDFACAAELIAPWVDGVDLNCGCPQSWALKEGIGCSLMEKPELVASMVIAAKNRIGANQSASCKIRIHKDLSQTVHFVKILEDAGVDFITVHGRTRSQRSSTPPNYEAIRTLKQHTKLPIIANGDCYSLSDAESIAATTNADGVMAARGILENPRLFSVAGDAPTDAVRSFLGHAVRCPIPFPLVLHHVSEMTARSPAMGKREKKSLMACQDMIDLIDWCDSRWG